MCLPVANPGLPTRGIRGANPKDGGANLLFGQILALQSIRETSM